MEWDFSMKNNKVMPLGTRINLEEIILNKSESERWKLYDCAYMWSLKNKPKRKGVGGKHSGWMEQAVAPAPVLSPGESHGRRSLVGYSPRGSCRVRHDWATSLSLFTFLHWRRKWQPTPVFLPGEFQGWRSLVGYSPWSRVESDMTERLHFHFSLSCTGEGNGNPLQCSCLENPRDGGAWWAAVYGVTQSRTQLKRLSSNSSSSSSSIVGEGGQGYGERW